MIRRMRPKPPLNLKLLLMEPILVRQLLHNKPITRPRRSIATNKGMQALRWAKWTANRRKNPRKRRSRTNTERNTTIKVTKTTKPKRLITIQKVIKPPIKPPTKPPRRLLTRAVIRAVIKEVIKTITNSHRLQPRTRGFRPT